MQNVQMLAKNESKHYKHIKKTKEINGIGIHSQYRVNFMIKKLKQNE